MRRVLRKIATKEEKDLGDLSTLADPEVVKALIGTPPSGKSNETFAPNCHTPLFIAVVWQLLKMQLTPVYCADSRGK